MQRIIASVIDPITPLACALTLSDGDAEQEAVRSLPGWMFCGTMTAH